MNSPVTRKPSLKRPQAATLSPTSKRARLIGNFTISVSANLLKSSDAYRGRCKYKSGRCPNERTLKFSGEAHTLCEEHRLKHNKNQRKSDAKRRGAKPVKKEPKTTTTTKTTTKTPAECIKSERMDHIKDEVVTIKLEPGLQMDGMEMLSADDLGPEFELEEMDMTEPETWSDDEVEILKHIFES
ncbi:hypothetical protein SDRG_00430 [Saprolegnia diclina VS20]|uniref:Uncharacterized protein n=1 Tax=Saprolegnia diclina (strain VS20) TaxID=1156394 RepID=T0SBB7_SAPDV|nr:hypothetical protein SDRG_00430 [Saprolegnia diclina VS20]EQC42703.1 hypothetical protein SDRG_00430 [Saprolegnia diclina VS20]|eukprot:XP_008604126.1 hypothetical protein SDRG_00430 [Saprolegnia diclina VS20]